MHEIGHAIGFFHEHQRRERDRFVTVDPSVNTNINYEIRDDDVQIGEYDCGSIMHYRSIPGLIVLREDSACTSIGQRNALSTIDIAGAAFTQGIGVMKSYRQSFVFGRGPEGPANEPVNKGFKDYSFPPSNVPVNRVIGGWWSLQNDASDSDAFNQFVIGGTSGSDNDIPTILGSKVIFRVSKTNDDAGLIRVLFTVMYE